MSRRNKPSPIKGLHPLLLVPGPAPSTSLQPKHVWQYTQPGRWVVQALPLFNINHASGGNPFAATPSHRLPRLWYRRMQYHPNCILIIEGMIDNNGFGPTCKNVAETFTGKQRSTHPFHHWLPCHLNHRPIPLPPANVRLASLWLQATRVVCRHATPGMAILQGFQVRLHRLQVTPSSKQVSLA